MADNLVSTGVPIYTVAEWLGNRVDVVESSYGYSVPNTGEINLRRSSPSTIFRGFLGEQVESIGHCGQPLPKLKEFIRLERGPPGWKVL